MNLKMMWPREAERKTEPGNVREDERQPEGHILNSSQRERIESRSKQRRE